MAIQIGVVKVLIGDVTATAADGTDRLLQSGDNVFADDLISTLSHSAIEIHFADGGVMDLGAHSQVMLSQEFFYPDATILVDAADSSVLSALASTSFLMNAEGDDILSGHEDDTSADKKNSDVLPVISVNDEAVNLADVLTTSANQISGVEYQGHLQIQLSNTEGVVHLINVMNIVAADDATAQSVLAGLLNAGNGEDVI